MPRIDEDLVIPFIIGEEGPLALSTSQFVAVTIWAEVLNGTWTPFGADTPVRVYPETLVYSANEWGPDKASFVLKRNPWAAWPDLQPFTPVEIWVGGVKCWEGRTNGTPFKGGSERQISVQCEGWQYHLDDDMYKRLYVHSTLSDWKDARSFNTAQLIFLEAQPQVQTEGDCITLTQPKGSSVVPSTTIGIVLDLGEAAARKVVVTLGESTFTGTGHHMVYCRTTSEPGAVDNALEEGWTPFQAEGAGGKSYEAIFTDAGRYLIILVYQTGFEGVIADDEFLKITGISVFSEPEYESGGVSVLRASTVVENALEEGSALLSGDLSQIDPYAGSGETGREDLFDIPSLIMATFKTPREMITAVNAFHNWLTQLDWERRMVFEPPEESPVLEFGSWSGEHIETTSAGEGQDIYNSVVAEGTEANGDHVAEIVASSELATPVSTIVDKRAFTRRKAVSLSNATTPTVAQDIGKAWLADNVDTPFAGSLTALVGSVRMVIGGQPVDPSVLPRYVNKQMRISHMVDPVTGGMGRDGRMVSCQYTHAERAATVSLDARTDNIEALLARLAVVSEIGS